MFPNYYNFFRPQYTAESLLEWLAPAGAIEKLFWHQGSGQAVVILADAEQVAVSVRALHLVPFCAVPIHGTTLSSPFLEEINNR
jgi:hypothetical protein